MHEPSDCANERLAAVQAERENVSSQLWDCMNECEGWKARADRAERILALLRKPSEGVVRAAYKSFYGVDKPNSLTWAIHAAFAAAEREVERS